MNDLKTEKRNSLSPRLLDALIRIKLHEDTLETFDVNRFTSRYLQTHLRCDGQLHETRDSQTGTSSGLNNSGDSGIISIGETKMKMKIILMFALPSKVKQEMLLKVM